MPKRMTRVALPLACCILFVAALAFGQDKAAPNTLPYTSSSVTAKAALVTALEEVTNIGGGRRFDAKLQAVIAADPSFAVGRAYYAVWTSTLTPAQRATELTRALTDAVANGTPAELLFVAGLRESQVGRNAIARDLYDVVMKLSPDDPNVALVRLLIAADGNDARRIAEASIAKFPTYAPTYNILAYRYNTDGRTEDALRMVAKYAELAPNHPNPHDSYAEILQLNGRYDEADKHYVKTLAIDPNFDEALVGRAEIQILQGNYAAARPYLEQSIGMARTPGRRILMQRELAAAHLYAGDIKRAKALLTTMVKDAQSHSINALPDLRTLAVIAAIEGNAAEANRLYKEGAPPTPGISLPFTDALLHALLNHRMEANQAGAVMTANAARAPDNMDAQNAMRATKVIAAVMNKDLDGARTAHQQVTAGAYKMYTAALLTRASNNAGDKKSAQASWTEVNGSKDVSMNTALARVIAKQK
jgi:tetratricopeptide (TPR) repeat protein